MLSCYYLYKYHIKNLLMFSSIGWPDQTGLTWQVLPDAGPGQRRTASRLPQWTNPHCRGKVLQLQIFMPLPWNGDSHPNPLFGYASKILANVAPPTMNSLNMTIILKTWTFLPTKVFFYSKSMFGSFSFHYCILMFYPANTYFLLTKQPPPPSFSCR